MQNELMEKYIRISRVIITLMVFIVLNAWFLFENDPHWIIALIISIVVFFINFPSSKICKFIINKGDKITNKILKVFYYVFALPVIFLLLLLIVGLLCACVVAIFINSLDLGTAILIAFIGIGILTCVLVPYFQTLIILILRCFLKFRGELK